MCLFYYVYIIYLVCNANANQSLVAKLIVVVDERERLELVSVTDGHDNHDDGGRHT